MYRIANAVIVGRILFIGPQNQYTGPQTGVNASLNPLSIIVKSLCQRKEKSVWVAQGETKWMQRVHPCVRWGLCLNDNHLHATCVFQRQDA
jgi:hypothetical protein